MKNKPFDAVKYMRNVRDGLSRKYKDNPQAQEKDLERIRKKHNIYPRKRVGTRKQTRAASN